MAEERDRSWLAKHDVSEGGWHRNAAQRAEEQRVCYELRLQGYALRDVARLASEALGWNVSPATAHRRVEDEGLAQVQPARAALLAQELDRLDRYLLALEAVASIGDAKERVAAVNSALKVQERRAKLLGLDQPEEHVVSHLGPEDVELAAMIREEQAKQAREEAGLLAQKRREARDGEPS